ncbi:chromosome segregation protein SMC [Actinomyces wuliandei]|uniref:chromosome segregation protein SMC n=1 Tax=Actinomyces wuliandei TaxID=2057743 RepID=UPI000FDBBC4E|nr:chromosome segregation protein SMC [Actinomyces wuliandei]
MHLKTLTIKGFKSFASSTTLRLEPGITAVVGPNGSGKSNVVDALTWVMGEQGAKNLRGGSMADVIFAGAGSRPALGRAEVSLTIDNTDGALPIDYTEVTISRTLFRGGGSEYRINGTSCRLLDVTELLSDTGLGRQMHSVVGQGQLDAVLTATPEDRRGFIEEAAGVLKHRRRKERALRKLEAMQADLARVSDLAQELRRQLGPLARQAAVARRAQTIQAEVRDATARLLADDVVQVQALLGSGEEDSAALVRRSREVDEAEAAARSRLEELTRLEATSVERLSQATDLWEDLTRVGQSLTALADVAAERVRLLASVPAPVRGTDPDELDRRAQAAAKEEAALAEAVEAARAVLGQAVQERAEAEKAQEEADRTLAFLQREQTERRERVARAGGRVASARSRYEASLAAVEQARTALSDAQERQGQARTELDSLAEADGPSGPAHQEAGRAAEDGATGAGSAGARAEEAAPARAAAAHEQATQALSRARDAVLAAADARREAASDYATWAARRDTLALSLRSQDGTAALLEEGPDGVLGALTQYMSVRRGWEKAVAGLLRGLAEAGLAVGADAALRALERARDQDAGPVRLVVAPDAQDAQDAPEADSPEAAPVEGAVQASALVAATLPGLHRVMDRLLGEAWVVDDLEGARRLRQARPDAVVATRAGEVLAPGWATGPGRASSSVLELAAAYEEARQAAQAAQEEESRADTSLEAARRQEEAAHRAVSEALDTLRRADAEAARQAQALARLTSAVQAATQETQRAQHVLERAEEEAARYAAELAAATTALAELEDTQGRRDAGAEGGQRSGEETGSGQSAHDVLEQARSRCAQALAWARQARQDETEARLALRTAEERDRSARGRADSLRAAARREREQREAARRAAKARAARLEVATVVRDQAREAARVAQAGTEKASGRRAAVEAEREQARGAADAVREEIDSLVQERTRLSDATHREEVARAERRTRLEALADKAMEDLGLEIEALVEGYGPHVLVPDLADEAEPRADAGPDGAEDFNGRRRARLAGQERSGGAGRPYVRAEQEKRLAQASRDLARLGKVNPLALEEHAALEQRHQFIAEQLADLKRSRDDLLSIVEEIDARVQEVFTSAFQDTAREFATVFDRLFPGGEGRLVPTDPDDMLATGVEIEARPAGKKVRRLSLLSGGERSLAAVALLIAIFRARPSPFYVLDEVEAALDDTNLGRLLEIITELRASSQLIIITHQKRTMEVADALYGITMREGITKAVSQRLARSGERGGDPSGDRRGPHEEGG